jgi:spermidine synthase
VAGSSIESATNYQDLYWAKELLAAKSRASGVSIARAAEVFILARKQIKTFLDIGTGPGFFLDAILKYLPDSDATFLGVERFPPEK